MSLDSDEEPKQLSDNIFSRLNHYSKKSVNLIQEKGVKEFSKNLARFLSWRITSKETTNKLHNKMMEKADQLKLLGPESIYAENYYAKRRKEPYRSETNRIGEVFKNEFNPETVIDFGCAIGTYLEPFYENNIDIQGVDANEGAFNHAVVPRKYLEYHDLREKYDSEKKYDLVISIEVAEHIPEKFTDTFVETLCNTSKEYIVMTAAPPGQGGTHHVNEKPREYWIDIFEQKGFKYQKEKVEELRNKINVEDVWHVKENLFVFKKIRTP